MKLFIGHEIYYYPSVPEWIEEGRVHTLADSNYVLLEFSTRVEKRELLEAVQNLCGYGYYPVLAHVERYDCLVKDPSYVQGLGYKSAPAERVGISLSGWLRRSVRIKGKGSEDWT